MTLFYRWAWGKDGYMARCKDCVQAEIAERRRRNPKSHRESTRRWQQEHPEEYRAYQKVYRTEFREELNAYTRRIRRERPDQRDRLNAGSAVYYAVKTGKLVPAQACQHCQGVGIRLQAHHHHGYGKNHRLDVVWLCRPCHEEADKVPARS